MKSSTLKVFASLALAITFALAPVQAQSSDRMTIAIPFAFTVGEETLSAGTYSVARTSQSGSAYMIQNIEGKGAAAVLSTFKLTGDRWPARGRLVFHSYNGEHYLAQVWMPTSGTGSAVSTSEAEERLAEGRAEPEMVAVLATQR
jgi:hypothetical protein